MFKSKDEFVKAAKAAEKIYKEAGLGKSWDGHDAFSAERVGVAWCVYSAVLKARKDLGPQFLGLVIGGLRTEEDPEQQGAGIDPKVKKNFGTMDETTKQFAQMGCVLDSKRWSVLVNDSWLLAGVHDAQEFFLASPRTEANVFDFAEGRLRVFGRELAGLRAFGYKFMDSPWPRLGEVEASGGGGLTADFIEYQKKAAEYQKNDKWRELLKK
ncbi:hypothetical protein [Streptomyces olivoreticuli]|uniref:hypothetical protein n=1 Tax=Streptomyces olivoreticuli TaxID=68246 RepID=UPI000E26E2FC|nr:hypothetical protein [Streptomyces olivoreticuli]